VVGRGSAFQACAPVRKRHTCHYRVRYGQHNSGCNSANPLPNRLHRRSAPEKAIKKGKTRARVSRRQASKTSGRLIGLVGPSTVAQDDYDQLWSTPSFILLRKKESGSVKNRNITCQVAETISHNFAIKKYPVNCLSCNLESSLFRFGVQQAVSDIYLTAN
jgi:hypothetical protein